MKVILEKIAKKANNVLYYSDNEDYCVALWEILALAKPELFIGDEDPELEFIEDVKNESNKNG